MYADSGVMFPYFRNFSQEVQELEELCYSQKPTSSLDSIITTSTISDYELGGEGDLFKAPELIIEEQMGLNPIEAAMAMISHGDDIMPPPILKVGEMELLQSEQLLSDAFDGCTKDLSEKISSKVAVSDVSDITLPPVMAVEAQINENKCLPDSSFIKCGSSGSLSSMEWVNNGATLRPNSLDLPELEFSASHGMRRAFSEGDIKALGNGNVSIIQSPLQWPLIIGNCTSEDRLQKLSRYRNKKSRRNFGRKIKYACRKALADSQPRIRGRFARTEDADACKKE